MVLRLIFVFVLTLIPAAAHAACEAEALKAREKILISGPLQYSARIWGDFYDLKKVGLIEPYTAEHMQEETGRNGPFRNNNRESITIGTQRWEKGDAGWFLPVPGSSTGAYDSVPPHEPILTAKCLGRVEIEGKSLTGYEYKTSSELYIERLFVDPSTDLTVRYERHADHFIFDFPLFYVISTYRYDASIKIEPPKVDVNNFPPPLEEREEVTGEHFVFGKDTKF